MENKTILIATRNEGKAKEFVELFEDYGYQIQTLMDFPEILDVKETGVTFKENALLKALTISKQLNTIVLADDSGLEVDALDGQPGVYSARFAGKHGDDQANNSKLLKELEGIPVEERKASFRCTLVLAGPEREPLVVEGNINGIILEKPRGEFGFGYDPLFYVSKLKKTMAELTSPEKNKISHRAVAIGKLQKHLKDWL